MDKRRLKGVIPALTTPFKADQSLDLDGLARLVDLVIGDGVDGVLVNGCTGESWALDKDERAAIFRTTVEAARGRVPVVAGCSGISAPETIAKVRQAQEAGCDTVMISPPWYILMGQEEIHDHYRTVLDAIEMPVMLYNIPRRTGVQISVDVVDRLADDAKVVAIKESSKDWGILSSMIRRVSDRISVLAGYASFYGLAAITEGAVGYVDSSTPVFGTRSVQFYRASRDGDVETARRIQTEMSSMLADFFGLGTFPASVKAALDLLGRPGGRTRDPIRPLTAAQQKTLREAMVRAGASARRAGPGARLNMSTPKFDTMVVGGGIMGCTVAFRLASAGQKVVLIERDGLCMQASGVNAGTLSIQIKRAALVPYAMRSWELWRTTREWLGVDVGFHQAGGITLAFTDEEAEMLTQRMAARKENGAPIEMVGPNRARELEPGLSDKAILASWCPMDAYASSYQLGDALRTALRSAGVTVREFSPVDAIEREDTGYVARAGEDSLGAKRVVVTGGVWIEKLLARDFGVRIPVNCRVNQVSVTERMPPIMQRVLGIATSLLTLKQSQNGTVLIGGGWQGKGNPERGGYEVVPENLVGNLRLAGYVIPALREARIVRTWLGLEGNVDDFMPLAGEIPGAPDAYVLGCVRGGFTIGPFIGTLMAQRILGREPEMPLFDPARAVVKETRGEARSASDALHPKSQSNTAL